MPFVLSVVDLRTVKSASRTIEAKEAPTLDSAKVGQDSRSLSAGDILFQEGEPRTCTFRVEAGGLCVYKTLPDGSRDVLEFAFSGDLVGLGYHDSHVSTAQATTQTSVSCLPLAASEPVNDEALRAKAEVGASVDREVALLRDALVHNSEPPPSERIAALFVTLSRCNGYEGRAADIITDSLKCGVVAGYLNMSLDVLASELAELESQGLIESAASGLRLKDLPALEKLADGIS